MTDRNSRQRVDQFIVDEIDSVPHLEALLILWNSRPKQWSVEELSGFLYVPREVTQIILAELSHRNLISAQPGASETYFCDPPSEETQKLLRDVDRTYRKELVRVSQMIHSKASAAVRDFARAFRFKKD